MTSAKRARSSAVMNHIDVCTSLMWWEANALFFSDLPPKTHNPSPIMRKSSDKLHRETSYKITDQYSLKLSRSSKKQGKSEKLPENQGEPKETWQLNAVWCPRWGFGDRKRHWIKIEENLSRLWTNINNGKAMQARAQLCPALVYNELALRIRWPKCWSFSPNPSNEYSGLISFRTDWFNLFTVQATLKSFLQHHTLKASILLCSAFFMVQFSHPYMTTRKTIALTIWTFVGNQGPY